MSKKFYCYILIALLPTLALSQTKTRAQKKAERKEKIDKLIKREEEGALIYQKQNIYGAKLNSDGYSVFFEKGYLKKATLTNLFSIELGERKSPKEAKSLVNGIFSNNFYIYGKINNFFYAKLGVAQSLLIGGKGARNGVAVSALYGGGLSIGLLKPIYLNIMDPLSQEQRKIKYNNDNSRNDSLFLNSSVIINSVGIFKGWNEMKVRPGLFVKTGLRFDYGHYNETVSAVEVGINAEYYVSKIPIMASIKEKNFFINLYAAIEFGKRK